MKQPVLKDSKNRLLEEIEERIKLDEYSKISQTHQDIVDVLSKSQVGYYNAIGILESVKHEIFLEAQNSQEELISEEETEEGMEKQIKEAEQEVKKQKKEIEQDDEELFDEDSDDDSDEDDEIEDE